MAGVLNRRDDLVLRNRLADLIQHLPEKIAVLCRAYRIQRRSQKTDVVLLQHARLCQIDCEIEAGLSTERRQQPVRPLPFDDTCHCLDGQRFDVDHVRDFVVGHDCGGVGVDEDGRNALLAERAACLRACVIELGGLADDNRSAAEHEHAGWALRRGSHAALPSRPAGRVVETSSYVPAHSAGTYDVSAILGSSRRPKDRQ